MYSTDVNAVTSQWKLDGVYNGKFTTSILTMKNDIPIDIVKRGNQTTVTADLPVGIDPGDVAVYTKQGMLHIEVRMNEEDTYILKERKTVHSQRTVTLLDCLDLLEGAAIEVAGAVLYTDKSPMQLEVNIMTSKPKVQKRLIDINVK